MKPFYRLFSASIQFISFHKNQNENEKKFLSVSSKFLRMNERNAFRQKKHEIKLYLCKLYLCKLYFKDLDWLPQLLCINQNNVVDPRYHVECIRSVLSKEGWHV